MDEGLSVKFWEFESRKLCCIGLGLGEVTIILCWIGLGLDATNLCICCIGLGVDGGKMGFCCIGLGLDGGKMGFCCTGKEEVVRWVSVEVFMFDT